VKIYVGAVEALQEKGKVFLNFHPVYDQTQGSGAVFFLLYRQLSNVWPYFTQRTL
jgi:hypothetical protein